MTSMKEKRGAIKDPFCDAGNPKTINFEDVAKARGVIEDDIMKTPCVKAERLSEKTGINVYVKKEFCHPTGSFKERGARYTLKNLPEEQKRKGVITASCGNHALALCYQGSKLNIPVYVYMPTVAPITKVEKCKKYAHEVIIEGSDISEAMEHALVYAQEKELMYVNGYDHPDILAGQGTIGLEICEQIDGHIDAVVVPIGGGGMVAGIAVAVKHLSPTTKIIGVESDKVPSYSEAVKAGKPVYVSPGATLADGLAVPKVGVNAFATASPLVEDPVIVLSEDKIAQATLRLIEEEKTVVEGGGATGVAALLTEQFKTEYKNKTVCVVLSGGNIDTAVLTRVLERGLVADNRLCRFVVIIRDRPGGLAELTRFLTAEGVNIKDIHPERSFLTSDVFDAKITCTVETRDPDHSDDLRSKLVEKYRLENVTWGSQAPRQIRDSTSGRSQDRKG